MLLHFSINHTTDQGRLQGFALKVANALGLKHSKGKTAAEEAHHIVNSEVYRHDLLDRELPYLYCFHIHMNHFQANDSAKGDRKMCFCHKHKWQSVLREEYSSSILRTSLLLVIYACYLLYPGAVFILEHF